MKTVNKTWESFDNGNSSKYVRGPLVTQNLLDLANDLNQDLQLYSFTYYGYEEKVARSLKNYKVIHELSERDSSRFFEIVNTENRRVDIYKDCVDFMDFITKEFSDRLPYASRRNYYSDRFPLLSNVTEFVGPYYTLITEQNKVLIYMNVISLEDLYQINDKSNPKYESNYDKFLKDLDYRKSEEKLKYIIEVE